MKNVILFVSFVLATNLFRNAESKRMTLEEIRENLLPVRNMCIERVGVDSKLIDEANNGNFVSDRKLQCYYKCLLVMTRVMTKDDKIIEKMFLNIAKLMLSEEYTKPFMRAVINCRSVASQKLEGCQLAFEAAKCLYNYDSSLMRFFP